MKTSYFSATFKAALVGLLLMIFYLSVLKPYSVLEIPKLKTQDLFFKIRNSFLKPRAILNDIILIVADDESIEKVNQKWPFKRSLFADLINDLVKVNPRVIAFDFVFSGKGEPLDDFLFSQAVESAGNVILASFVDTNGNYILPSENFLVYAESSGVINKLQDRDLVVRRANLVYQDKLGQIVGLPWELEIARQVSGLNRNDLKLSKNRMTLGTFNIPFNEDKKIFINYRFNLKDTQHIPFWKLMEDKNLLQTFKGKIVLIGATSKVLHDYYRTRVGIMPGVVINMNLLANFLSHDFLKKTPQVLSLLFLLIFSFGGIYLSFEEKLIRAIIIFAGASILFLVFNFLLFLNNFLTDSSTPLIFGWSGFIAISFYRYIFTLIENIQLRSKVILDPLTGLYNRRLLESSIDQQLEKSGKRELSVMMIDIDNFKHINDTYGHQFGDDVIKNVSFAIKEELHEGAIAVRYGGEEFCVIFPRKSKEEATQIAEKIRKKIAARKFSYVNQVTHFTVSIGVASSKPDQLSASRSLIDGADRALYKAKHNGKNQVAIYEK